MPRPMSSRKEYPFNPGGVLSSGNAFAKRHGLEGKKVSAADLPPKYYILDMFPYPSGAGLHVDLPRRR